MAVVFEARYYVCYMSTQALGWEQDESLLLFARRSEAHLLHDLPLLRYVSDDDTIC